MAKLTPIIGTKGRFTLSNPWVLSPGELYQVVAIRTLEDLAKTGLDPKTSIYARVGLVDGVNGFSWKTEEEKNPFFITLLGSSGNKIIVPDTYINSYPDLSATLYHKAFISVSLGACPENEDLTDLANDLADLARSRTSLAATAKIFSTPIITQPTNAEHLAYVYSRENNRPDVLTNAEEIAKLKAEIQYLKLSNFALITRLKNVNGI